MKKGQRAKNLLAEGAAPQAQFEDNSEGAFDEEGEHEKEHKRLLQCVIV